MRCGVCDRFQTFHSAAYPSCLASSCMYVAPFPFQHILTRIPLPAPHAARSDHRLWQGEKIAKHPALMLRYEDAPGNVVCGWVGAMCARMGAHGWFGGRLAGERLSVMCVNVCRLFRGSGCTVGALLWAHFHLAWMCDWVSSLYHVRIHEHAHTHTRLAVTADCCHPSYGEGEPTGPATVCERGAHDVLAVSACAGVGGPQ